MGAQDSMGSAVLGIDPGSRKTGWAVIAPQGSGLRYIDSGCIVLDARTPLVERLGKLLDALQGLFAEHPAAELAIEAAFVHENPHTALVLGQARGLPIALAAQRGMAVHEYPPALVKRRVVGSGRADKMQMREMVRIILGLQDLPGEDEADALAVAIAHLRGVVLPVSRPAAPLAAPAGMTSARAHYLALVQSAQRPRARRPT